MNQDIKLLNNEHGSEIGHTGMIEDALQPVSLKPKRIWAQRKTEKSCDNLENKT